MAANPGLNTNGFQGASRPGIWYKLRALHAPMYDARTGKKCQEVCLLPGRVYTFGRSRRSCDIIFLDGRVSRQHCQVYLDPEAKKVCIIEGTTDENLHGYLSRNEVDRLNSCCVSRSTRVQGCEQSHLRHALAVKRVHLSEHAQDEGRFVKRIRRFGLYLENFAEAREHVGPVEDDSVSLDFKSLYKNAHVVPAPGSEDMMTRATEEHYAEMKTVTQFASVIREPYLQTDNARGLEKYISHSQCSCALSLRKSKSETKKNSLNGLFVDGEKLGDGGHRVLKQGSEVSLVARTVKAQPVDPDFGEALGFVLVVESSGKIISPFSCLEIEEERVYKARCGSFDNAVCHSASCWDGRPTYLSRNLGETGSSEVAGEEMRMFEGKFKPVFFGNSFLLEKKGNGLLGTEKICAENLDDGIVKRLVTSKLGLMPAALSDGNLKQGGPLKSLTGKFNTPQSSPLEATFNKLVIKLMRNERARARSETLPGLSGSKIVVEATGSEILHKSVRDERSRAQAEIKSGQRVSNSAAQSAGHNKSASTKQLRESTCRFLSASDCARTLHTRSLSAVGNPVTNLTDAIELTVRECLVERTQEPQRCRGNEEVSFSGLSMIEPVSGTNSHNDTTKVGTKSLPRVLRIADFESVARISVAQEQSIQASKEGETIAAFFPGRPQKALFHFNADRKREVVEAPNDARLRPGRLQSHSSNTTRFGKAPKRSTTEILRLLRQGCNLSPNVSNVIQEDSYPTGPDEQPRTMVMQAATSEQEFRHKPTGKSSACRVIDGLLTVQDVGKIPASDNRVYPEDVNVYTRHVRKLSSNKNAIGQECLIDEKEDVRSASQLGRKFMSPADDPITQTEAEGLNGRQRDSKFLLNRLKDMEPSPHSLSECVSLQDLLNPVDDLVALFVATFTSDVRWFLSSHNLSAGLPVTVACHDRERCWSTSDEARSSSPFPDWPNVNLVYPPFPDCCCFSTEKRQGIGCHHPKIFLLLRQGSIRVIITSANLTRKQWFHVTNSVWFQDFPRRDSCDLGTLFCKPIIDDNDLSSSQTSGDFAVHLSSFVASLVAEVPSATHWVLRLAEYDFTKASASLVTSTPGLHGCPCPPVPRSIWDVINDDKFVRKTGFQHTRKVLATLSSNVVGVSHRFKDTADPCGTRIRALANVLNDHGLLEDGLLTVQLKRTTNVPADPNAVSVIVSPRTSHSDIGMVFGKDLMQMTPDPLPPSPNGSIHIGFLPRSVAKWVAPLYDSGLCTFAARIWPNEVLAVATGFSKTVIKLVMYVFEGQNFSCSSTDDLSLGHKVALASLLRSMERSLGLWRLHEVLCRYNWPDSAETNFIFGSSSIGTSLDAEFLAAFSVAAGKRLMSSDSLDESDPEWGAWTAEHEAKSPSIGLVFPTVERIKSAKGGPCTHQGIMCFAESTWERLKPARLLHDAVPFPAEREGFPMHVKVAQRRFQNNLREPPYGWIYCGSHNFSPAAWGRPLPKAVHSCKCSKTALGCTLFISNYEAGLIFVEPPPTRGPRKLKFKPLIMEPDLFEELEKLDIQKRMQGLDKFVLPFCVPAPKYRDVDKPATGRAVYSAVVDWRKEHLPDMLMENFKAEYSVQESSQAEDCLHEIPEAENSLDESCEADMCVEEMHPFPASEDDTARLPVDMLTEEKYGETLWSQMTNA